MMLLSIREDCVQALREDYEYVQNLLLGARSSLVEITECLDRLEQEIDNIVELKHFVLINIDSLSGRTNVR